MSSSDDDVPLAARPSFLLTKTAKVNRVVDSDDDSMPSWLADVKAPVGGVLAALSDSDSNVKEVLSPAQVRPSQQEQTQQQTQAAAGASQQQPTQQPSSQQQQEQQAPRSGGKRTPAGRASAAARATQPSTQQPPSQQQQPTQPQIESTQPSQPTQPLEDRPGPPTALKKVAGRAGLQAPSREMPVVLPEKLAQAKLLVELEDLAGAAHGATDLSGDSGAIGRLLITGAPKDPQLQLDLKGVLYNATIVPCPVTMAIVNMGQAEAKVETLFTEFVQLREDTRFNIHDGAGLFDLGADDDDDHYMAGDPGEADAEGGTAAAAKKKAGRGGKKAAGAGAAGAKAAGASRKRAPAKPKPKGAKGGVKKAASKPRKKPGTKPKK